MNDDLVHLSPKTSHGPRKKSCVEPRASLPPTSAPTAAEIDKALRRIEISKQYKLLKTEADMFNGHRASKPDDSKTAKFAPIFYKEEDSAF